MRLMSWIRDGRNEPDGRTRNRFRHPNRRAPPDRSEGRGNRELGSRRDDRRCLRRCGAIARCRNWVTRVEIDESRARNAETKTQLSPKNEYAAVSSRRGRRIGSKVDARKRASYLALNRGIDSDHRVTVPHLPVSGIVVFLFSPSGAANVPRGSPG